MTGPVKRSRTERAAAFHDTAAVRGIVRALPSWRGVLILNYHRIGDPAGQPWDRTLWSTTGEGLAGHVQELQRHVDVVGPEDLLELAARGRGRYAMLTFDDGYRDNYEIAFPVLRRHGVTAGFFVATGFVDRPRATWWDEIAWMVRNAEHDLVPAEHGLHQEVRLAGPEDDAAIRALVERYKQLPGHSTNDYLNHLGAATGAGRCPDAAAAQQWMTWDMAREMRDAGMAIGGHTVDHPILSSLPPAEQEQEIAGCAQRMREELGEPMRWFAYPVGARGSFDEHTRAILARAGVELAFSFYGGHQSFSRWDPLDIRRVHVGPHVSRQILHSTVRLPHLFARTS